MAAANARWSNAGRHWVMALLTPASLRFLKGNASRVRRAKTGYRVSLGKWIPALLGPRAKSVIANIVTGFR